MHIMKIETQIKLHSEDAMQKTGIVASGWVEIGDCIKFPVRVMKYTDKTSGEEKSFVSYPQRKTKDGYEVIVFPHDKEARKEIDAAIFSAMKMELLKDVGLPEVEIRVTPIKDQNQVNHAVRLKGVATARISELGLTIKGILIKESEKGLFVQMPQYKSDEGYKDIVYATTKTMQEKIKMATMDAHEKALSSPTVSRNSKDNIMNTSRDCQNNGRDKAR